MKAPIPTEEEALALASRVNPKFSPVWDSCGELNRIALSRYFLRWSSRKPILEPERPRVIKWYCLFAGQKVFPSGHRYCINVNTGCDHSCTYCYANSYEPDTASPKAGFEKLVDMDMNDLENFDLPPAPVHLSNSTDCFQPLERLTRHTKYALEQILIHRQRFTTVTILTKNPLLPVRDGYLPLFRKLMAPSDHPSTLTLGSSNTPAFQMEVSLAFWRDDARAAYEEDAPSVQDRLAGVRALRQEGIPVVLRIDPLFPRSPLPMVPPATLQDFGLVEAQTLEDLDHLVRFAAEVGARHVVYSPLKVVQPRRRKIGATMTRMRDLYKAVCTPSKPVWRGGSWRLPKQMADQHIVGPFLEVCRRHGVNAKFCMRNLTETP